MILMKWSIGWSLYHGEVMWYFLDGNMSLDKSELTRGNEVGDDVGGDMSVQHLTV